MLTSIELEKYEKLLWACGREDARGWDEMHDTEELLYEAIEALLAEVKQLKADYNELLGYHNETVNRTDNL